MGALAICTLAHDAFICAMFVSWSLYWTWRSFHRAQHIRCLSVAEIQWDTYLYAGIVRFIMLPAQWQHNMRNIGSVLPGRPDPTFCEPHCWATGKYNLNFRLAKVRLSGVRIYSAILLLQVEFKLSCKEEGDAVRQLVLPPDRQPLGQHSAGGAQTFPNNSLLPIRGAV